MFHFHEPPPPTLPVVIQKEKEAYQFWLALHRNFPKIERFSIGQKIEQSYLAVLELTFTAAYLPPDQKIILLGKTISQLDILKFFAQLAWESKLIPTDKFTELSTRLEEIGRMLGGWRKGLQSKTLPQNSGRGNQ
ncbi:MAG TPA: hypothetical protein DEB07_00375 [Candidatus Moranbacteria bacterium]|nr:hypothetical protein [Candidatus Moranbacteria bacterium]